MNLELVHKTAQKVACPVCRQYAGEACVTSKGNVAQYPHVSRIKAAQEARKEARRRPKILRQAAPAPAGLELVQQPSTTSEIVITN